MTRPQTVALHEGPLSLMLADYQRSFVGIVTLYFVALMT